MTSERTKSLIRKKRIFGAISFSLFLGITLFLVIYSFITVDMPQPSGKILSEEAKSVVMGVSVTGLICLIGTIIIKDKIRVAMWMFNLILSVFLFDRVGMCIVLGVWFIDEYVFFNLYKRYKKLIMINKEIDLR